jgi:hypothetical protein
MNDLINMIFFTIIFIIIVVYFRDINYNSVINSIKNTPF